MKKKTYGRLRLVALSILAAEGVALCAVLFATSNAFPASHHNLHHKNDTKSNGRTSTNVGPFAHGDWKLTHSRYSASVPCGVGSRPCNGSDFPTDFGHLDDYGRAIALADAVRSWHDGGDNQVNGSGDPQTQGGGFLSGQWLSSGTPGATSDPPFPEFTGEQNGPSGSDNRGTGDNIDFSYFTVDAPGSDSGDPDGSPVPTIDPSPLVSSQIHQVPEPGALPLLFAGLIGAFTLGRRKGKSP